jgi:Holliday junction resolvase RusA-like endonuclease
MGRKIAEIMIRFTVFGTPQGQGSKTPWLPRRKDGSFVMKNGRPIIATMDSNKNLKSWRQELSKEAMAAVQEHDCPIPRNVAVAVVVGFYFAKPKSTKKSVDKKVTKPDVDKLLRAALDGMTGIIYHDDSQVTDARVKKFFGLPERAEIAVGLAE